MKALTIRQPWASLVACGAKVYETRSWPTKYCGQIAIHAAVKDPQTTWNGLSTKVQRAVLAALLDEYPSLQNMPRGAVIATAELVECWKVISDNQHRVVLSGIRSDRPAVKLLRKPVREILNGDFTPGRYAWEVANLVVLEKPVPAKQGLWDWNRRRTAPPGCRPRAR